MAKNATITTCDWTEFTIPFDYESYKYNEGVANYNNSGGAILVTFGTNADAGQGSSGDEVYVDDMVLVYNHDLASVVYDGTNVTVAPSMDLSDQYYDESKLALTHNAKGNATIDDSNYNKATGLLTITVKGENYGEETETDYASMFKDNTSKSTYTIQFKPYEAELLSLTYDGKSLPLDAANMTEAVITGPFDDTKLSYTQSDYATVQVNDYFEEERVLSLDVTSKDGGASNTYEIQLYYKGDVNNDGSVTIADVTSLVNIILGKTTDYKEAIADVNGDGSVTIADVTALVNIILGKQN